MNTTQPTDPAPFTPDEIEAFFHTANMLMQCVDQIEKRVPKRCREYDRDILLARASYALMMDIVCGSLSEAEFDALQAKYYGDDGDADGPAGNHPGTERVQ